MSGSPRDVGAPLPPLAEARWVYTDDGGRELPPGETGYALLVLRFADGRETAMNAELKLLAHGIPAVALSPDAGGRWFGAQVVEAIDPADGRPRRFAECTADPRIVRLARDFYDAVVNREFAPRVVFPA